MTSVTSIDGIPLVDDDLVFGTANAKRMERIPAVFRKAMKLLTALFIFKKHGQSVNVIVKRPSVPVFAAMPNPVPYRGVSIGVVGGYPVAETAYHSAWYGPDLFSPSGRNTGPGIRGQSLTATLHNSSGDVVGTVEGSRTEYNPSAVGGGGGETVRGYNDAYDAWYVIYANYFEARYASDTFDPLWVTLNGDSYAGPPLATPVSPSYAEILAADQAAGTGNSTVAVASNGQVLGRMAQDPGTGYPQAEVTMWNGDGYVEMFSSGADGITPEGRLTFVVPEDCVYPLTPMVPSAGTGIWVNWNADWDAAYKVGVARRKAWFKKNSDATLAQLMSGVLPAGWDYALKANAPVSSDTSRNAAMTETYSSAVASDTTTGDSRVIVTEQTVELSYSGAAWTGGGTKTQTYTGYKNDQGAVVVTYSRDEYVDWYDGPSGVAPYLPRSNVPQSFLEDGSGKPLGSIWNGVIQNGYNADSTWGAPNYAPTTSNLTPSVPSFSNATTGAILPFVAEYRAANKPKYAVGSGDSTWNDSALMDKMVVTLTPYAPILDGASLGVFHYIDPSDDAHGATQIEIYGSARFVYNYATGTFSFIDWTDNPATIDLPTGVGSPHGNCLVRYSNIYWPDLENISPRGQSPDNMYYDAIQKALNP